MSKILEFLHWLLTFPTIRGIRSCIMLLTAFTLIFSSLVQAREVKPGVYRTPESRFANITDYPYEPHYAEIKGLRMHYVDEGVAREGTFVLLHGEPVWGYMYRGVVPGLTEAGYRVIIPDMIGFGKSDKVIDREWYTVDQHVEMVKSLIRHLDLENITLVVNDWGGPTGLITAVEMPDRFVRLFILNTWLHHDGMVYTQALRDWHARSQNTDFLNVSRSGYFGDGGQAPFDSELATAGAYRWPWMLPFARPEEGSAVRQAAAYAALGNWNKPAHVIFGQDDQVFNEQWGREFAAHIPGATIDIIPGEGHRPLLNQAVNQPYRADELVELMLRRIAGN